MVYRVARPGIRLVRSEPVLTYAAAAATPDPYPMVLGRGSNLRPIVPETPLILLCHRRISRATILTQRDITLKCNSVLSFCSAHFKSIKQLPDTALCWVSDASHINLKIIGPFPWDTCHLAHKNLAAKQFHFENTRIFAFVVMYLAKTFGWLKKLFSFLFLFFFLVFLGLYSRHMEVPRLGVESELQLLAYTTAIGTPDLSCVCYLHHSSQHLWILNPLNGTRDHNLSPYRY